MRLSHPTIRIFCCLGFAVTALHATAPRAAALERLCGLGAAAQCRRGLSQGAIGGGVGRIETEDLGKWCGGLGTCPCLHVEVPKAESHDGSSRIKRDKRLALGQPLCGHACAFLHEKKRPHRLDVYG